MKSIKWILIGVLILISMPVFAAEDWVLYAEGPYNQLLGGKTKYYYDRTTLKQVEKGLFEFMQKEVYGDVAKKNYSISQYWINCNNNKAAIGEAILYFAGTKGSPSNLFDKGWFKLQEWDPKTNKMKPMKIMQIICN